MVYLPKKGLGSSMNYTLHWTLSSLKISVGINTFEPNALIVFFTSCEKEPCDHLSWSRKIKILCVCRRYCAAGKTTQKMARRKISFTSAVLSFPATPIALLGNSCSHTCIYWNLHKTIIFYIARMSVYGTNVIHLPEGSSDRSWCVNVEMSPLF